MGQGAGQDVGQLGIQDVAHGQPPAEHAWPDIPVRGNRDHSVAAATTQLRRGRLLIADPSADLPQPVVADGVHPEARQFGLRCNGSLPSAEVDDAGAERDASPPSLGDVGFCAPVAGPAGDRCVLIRAVGVIRRGQ